MRLPKKVNISGKSYSVRRNRTQWGGSCRTGAQEIVVGTASNQSAERKFTNFAHEVMESVALERSLRYEASDEEIVFVMNHKQFDDYACDVATALFPLMKK